MTEKFKCIMMDPPWRLNGGGKWKEKGSDPHYNTARVKDMPDIIRASGMWKPDPEGCHLWMWTTNNRLPDALWLMEELGFRYVTNACWAKGGCGIGRYLRTQHELLLFGTMGRAMVPAPGGLDMGSLIAGRIVKKTRHSEKPQEQYMLMERVSPGPYLEMFARTTREGWTSWGDELNEGEWDEDVR